jgi:uncharacterized protein (DUF433 family)
MVVHELLDRGVPHRKILQAVRNLRGRYGDWPLVNAPLATTEMRRVLLANTDEFLLLLEGGTQFDAAHRVGTQTMLGLTLGLRAVTDLLRRGGWAMKSLPQVKNIEVDPDRLSGRPTIRNRRIPAEKVARMAGSTAGRQTLESDYRLNRRQIEDALRWYRAVSRFEEAA